MLYDKTLKEIIEKKERKVNGQFNGIPVPFSKYSEYFDSFDKGSYVQLLGGTGVGKSSLKHHLIYSMVEFSYANDYPIKILDFSLEDVGIEVCKKRIIHYLWKRHKIDISQKYLNSKDYPLDDRYINLIKQDELFFRKFENTVAVVNDCTNPDEIHKMCENAYEKYGKTHHIVIFIDNYANVTRGASDESE